MSLIVRILPYGRTGSVRPCYEEAHGDVLSELIACDLLANKLVVGFIVVEGIYESVQMLRQFPEMGHRYDRHPDQHIRILIYGHYRIAYLGKPDGDIDVLGVFHGALDIERYLF